VTDTPWLDDDGGITVDPAERAREIMRRIEVLGGVWHQVRCPACGSTFATDGMISAAFMYSENAANGADMLLLSVACQRCPYVFTFDVGRNGFGDLPERSEQKVLPEGIDRLKELPCYESKGAALEQQLLHIMVRSENWGACERPENYPLWRPEDFEYHLVHFFDKLPTKEDVEKALVQLQKDGTVERTDGGWCLVSEEDAG
jgi:hypothetical protein